MLKTIKKIIAGIFSDWNGVQTIIAPSIIVFLFDEYTFINWFTGVFSYHRYYIPVMLYVLFLSAFIFFGLKSLFAWDAVSEANRGKKFKTSFFKDYFTPYMLHMHVLLLLYLTLFMLLYIVKSLYLIVFPGYFPFMSIVFFLLRFGFIAAFLYNYFLIELSIPIVQRGHSFRKAQTYLKTLVSVRTKNFLLVSTIQIVWIYLSILVFKLIVNLLDDILIILGLSNSTKGLVISFFAVSNVYHFVLNVLMLLTAFLVLNIIYYPVIVLLKMGLTRVRFTLRDI